MEQGYAQPGCNSQVYIHADLQEKSDNTAYNPEYTLKKSCRKALYELQIRIIFWVILGYSGK